MQTPVKRSFSSSDGRQHQSPEWFNEISHRFENSYDRHAKAYVKKLLNEVHVNNEKNPIKDKKRIPALEGELIDLKKELKMTKQMMSNAENQCGGSTIISWIRQLLFEDNKGATTDGTVIILSICFGVSVG
ncbi:hypothetical protein niasHS_005461 [Heterodera schachtii]|uniref:Uncharacterized protein n=1 Tax=Heterodera schachtii TaxID=97005 RepID=A0ABD2JJ72_HETSC